MNTKLWALLLFPCLLKFACIPLFNGYTNKLRVYENEWNLVTCKIISFFFSKSELPKLSMNMDSIKIKIFNENKWETLRERQNTYLNRNQFSSVTQPCQILCNLMDWSMPGFLFHHCLLEFAQTHVHRVGDDIQPSHPLLSPSPPAFNLSQHQGLFQWVSSLHQVAKVLMLQLQHQSFQWIFRTDFL